MVDPWRGLEGLERRLLLDAGPIVIVASLNGGAAQRSTLGTLLVGFDEDVGASLDVDDLVLTRVGGGAVDLTGASVSYDGPSNAAMWDLTGLPADRITDGFYRARLVAGGITNSAGDPLDGDRDGEGGDDYEFGLHRLSGDVNGDGTVNGADAQLVRQNWLLPAGQFAPAADVNSDGAVNVFDYRLIRQNYMVRLEPSVPLDRVSTPAELAAALHYRPERIYEHVVNTVRYEPYGGAMKGPAATLETGRGSPWDQSILLAEALDEAGVYCRFVTGQVEADVQPVMDWVGATEPDGASLILSNADANAIRIIDSGSGETIAIRFDHVWVEGLLPNDQGLYEWLAMDASWKLRDYRPGVPGLLGLVPFDEADYLSQVRPEPAGEYYARQVADYLLANVPGASLADVPYDGPIIPRQIDAIDGAMPYATTGPETIHLHVPWEWTHRVQVSLYRADGSQYSFFHHILTFPDMSLNRVTLSYADAGGGQLLPELRVGGQVVATGAGTSSANEWLAIVLYHVNGDGDSNADEQSIYYRQAGRHVAIGFDAGQLSERMLDRQQQDINNAALAWQNGEAFEADDQIGALLARAVLGHFHETNELERLVYGLTGAVPIPNEVASGLATAQGSHVTYHADLQNPALPLYSGLAVDIDNDHHLGIDITGDQTSFGTREQILFHNNSAMEHAIWEEVANTRSISTIKSLQLANERGIPILTIDGTWTTETQIRDALQLSTFTENDIVQRWAAGEVITIPREPTDYGMWDGVGFIAERPGGGRGYIISGGLGWTPASAASAPSDSGAAAHEHPLGWPDGLQIIQGGTTVDRDPEDVDDEKGNTHEPWEVIDPINVANGNVTRDELDVSLPGAGVGLSLARHYDSQSDIDVGFGPGWVHTYGDFLTFEADDSVTWTTGAGVRYPFASDGTGGFVAPATLHGTLTCAQSLYTYRDPYGLRRTFDDTGRMVEIRDRNDNVVELTYSGGKLHQVIDADAPARRLTFGHTGDRIASVADHTGRTWTYGYDAGDRLASVTTPSDPHTPAYTTSYEYYTDAVLGGKLRRITQRDGGVIRFTYYANGRGYSQTDPEGNTSFFSYDLYRNLSTLTDPLGNRTVYEYNEQGSLIGLIHADGARESWEVADGLQKSYTDPAGLTETYDHDAAGNIIEVVDRVGNVTAFVYEPTFNQMTLMDRPGARDTVYDYDANGNLERITDSEGGVTEMTYDARGLMLTLTDPRGTATPAIGDYTRTYNYNDAGQMLTCSTDLPSTESYVYDPRGWMTTAIDANGQAATYDYDALGRITRITDALGGVTTNVYGPLGGPVSTTDPLGRTAEFVYDRNQRLVETSLPDGSVISRRYDAAGNMIAEQNAAGHITTYGYDTRNRLASTHLADGGVCLARYDGATRLVEARDAAGNVTVTEYDALGRAVAVHDAAGGTATMTYDAVDNLRTVTDPQGRTIEYEYDSLSRRISETDDLGHTSTYDYDGVGNVLSITDADGRITEYTYDSLNRRLTTSDAMGNVTAAVYGPAGNLLSVTDPEANTLSYSYDVLNRLVSETDALGGVRTFTYDAVGNLLAYADRNGRVTQFTYDAMDRRVREQWMDGKAVVRTLTYGYDPAGNRVFISDADATYTYTVDGLGRMTSADNAGTPGVPNVVMSYDFDTAGNLTELSDSLGGVIGVVYDGLSRVTQVTQSGPGVAEKRADYTYAANAELDTITRYADLAGTQLVATSTYGYDTAGRLTSLGHTRGAAALADYSYVLDANYRPTEITSLDGVAAYDYDDSGQLLSADYDYQADESYTYDDNGNRIGGGSVIGAGNRLMSDETYDYEYDGEGNRIRRVHRAGGEVTEYAWDHRNRLTGIVHTDAAGAVVKEIGYSYDGLDRRIRASVDPDGAGPAPAEVEAFVYHGNQIALVFDGAGALTHRYFHGPGTDQVLAEEDGGGHVVWALSDPLGTVRDLVDAAGNVVNHLTYDAFGQVTSQTDPSVKARFAYTGRELDAQAGLYYYRARHYDAATGRFLSEDSFGYGAGATNSYAYAGNGPTFLADPSGHNSIVGGALVALGYMLYSGRGTTKGWVGNYVEVQMRGFSDAERNYVKDTVTGVYDVMWDNMGDLNVIQEVITPIHYSGKVTGSCVDSARDRAELIANYLPDDRWAVGSFTYAGHSLHTFNVISYNAKDGKTYYWKVDTYFHFRPEFTYMGTIPPTEWRKEHWKWRWYQTHGTEWMSPSQVTRTPDQIINDIHNRTVEQPKLTAEQNRKRELQKRFGSMFD